MKYIFTVMTLMRQLCSCWGKEGGFALSDADYPVRDDTARYIYSTTAYEYIAIVE